MADGKRQWRRAARFAGAAALAFALAGSAGTFAAGLDAQAQVVFDQYDNPTIFAQTEHDAIFLQGYLHAKDRFFQMDFQRRLFAGRAAELAGSAALPQDVQLRTLGLGRAAARSLPEQTPETMAWLEAYSAGVNAWLADPTQALPLEYTALEITKDGVPPWTPLDSLLMAKGLAFGLSFDLGDIDRTLALLNFRGVGEVLGFNGLQLYNGDLYRAAPFDPTISIPSGSLAPELEPEPPAEPQEYPGYFDDPNFGEMVRTYRDSISEIPILERALEFDFEQTGSNWWVVNGDKSETGNPILSNDPHLSLGSPATFYEVHLIVDGGINVAGVSFPGAPGLVQGCNETICWGSTVNPLDVTDVYQEVLLALDPSQPTTPTHTLFQGSPEPLQFIPQQFLVNAIGDGVPNTLVDAGLPADQGGVTLVVPRRNNGPIVQTSFDPTSPTPLTGISVMYTGWSATRELETFRLFARAGSMQDFKDALQYFDVGSQNWSYADVNGNIAYYTSAELPLREDLQTLLFPAGLAPPYLIRDGTNTNPHEWLPLTNPQPGQAIPYETLPFAEMPQIENPASGVILNANNDPIGTSLDNVSWNQFRAGFNGLLYLSPGYATGYRIGRIQRLFDDVLAGGGKLSIAEATAIQANNQLLDAEVLTPYLVTAFANASDPGAPAPLAALGADPGVAEAIGRLGGWDFSTPTGIDQGFDPGDNPLAPGPASAAEIQASVAATIYSTWRGQVVQRVVDGTLNGLPVPLGTYAPGSDQAMTALKQLLETYSTNGGTGQSLIDFFVVPGVTDPFARRDIVLLQALRDALDLLASDDFAPAFANSTDQEDYRWGKLHRIVFSSYLGGPFNLPPPGSPLNVSPELPGVARAGGMGAVDASSHSARADGLNDFMFGSGPARRVVAHMTPDGPDILEVIPGGASGVPGSPHQTDQLFLWLVNLYHPLPIDEDDVNALGTSTLSIACGDGVVGPGEQCDDANADQNDGCHANCMVAPIVTCAPDPIPADAETCDATLDCAAIASCVDFSGNAAPISCDTDGSTVGPGTYEVTVSCSAAQTTVVACSATVADETPPTFSVEVSPGTLWPPNHRLVPSRAIPAVSDACGGTSVVLESIVSSEPDDAPGDADGFTTDDVQGAVYGTYDLDFQLRAERSRNGEGRTYTVTYVAADEAGNTAEATDAAEVDYDRLGMFDPIVIDLGRDLAGTVVSWEPVDDAVDYNVIRGDLAEVHAAGNTIDLGAVKCIEIGSTDTTTAGGAEDGENPAPGVTWFYLVEYDDGSMPSSYGAESAGRARLPATGACPN